MRGRGAHRSDLPNTGIERDLEQFRELTIQPSRVMGWRSILHSLSIRLACMNSGEWGDTITRP
ncbi:hypothetical protein AN958_00165 [Leucoagaricus sp. SymC.cos]|nr:hypothetical protein AN958_00165 [Leucoagaricus sp. SymC.cos]